MKIVFLFASLLISQSLFSQKIECSNLKNLTFGPKDSKYKITRNENIQIENIPNYHNGEDLIMEWKVTWISDCKYKRDFIQFLEHPSGIDIGFPRNYLIEIIAMNDSTIMELIQVIDPGTESSKPFTKEYFLLN